jgi:hypothetical protein
MTSPFHALLWEIWRVTRVEAAWKFALGLTGALAALAWTHALSPADDPAKTRAFGAAVALTFIVAPQLLSWMFLPRLNGHRPGFPLRLLFDRPIRTVVMVGLPLAYLSVVPAMAYLASALLLRGITGYPFPLLSVAAWIATLNLVLQATSWSARRISVTTLVVSVISGAWMMLAGQRLVSNPPEGFEWHDSPMLWPKIFNFPLTDYVWIAVIGLAAFWVAVARVGRQRSGDAPTPHVLWTPGAGYPEWLVSGFRFPCPTSSATRAQVWFDLKARGFPVLTIALTLAISIPLLFAVSVPIDAALTEALQPSVSCAKSGCFWVRPMVLLFSGLCLVVMLFQGGNAFGIRYKQGRVYLSAFEVTQAYDTARLAILKLLVRSACFLVALMALGASIWASLPLLGDSLFIQMWNVPLGNLLGVINSVFAALDWLDLLALAVVVAIGAVVWVAAFAALGALWVAYPRRGNFAASALLLCGLALALLALAGRYGMVPAFLVDAIFTATRWVAVAALVITTAYVVWRGFAERVLTIRYACGVLVISAAFGAAWLTLLAATGAQPAVPMLWPLPLALMAGVLAPWALNRVRHT